MLDRDCGLLCPYAAHAPASLEGAAVWSAGTACVTATMAGPDLDMTGAFAAARELGASGWAAAELLLAMRLGLAEGGAARRADVPTDFSTDTGGVTHGGQHAPRLGPAVAG